MKFAVGYPVRYDDDLPFVEALAEYRDHIEEVYFAWPGEPSGRSPAGNADGQSDAETIERMRDDLVAIKAMGIKLDVLFNANCYGGLATSTALASRVSAIVDELIDTVGLNAVTTTSPFIAAILKQRHPSLEIRASINMRIGTIQAMEYVRDRLDGFYMQREFNRDFARIAELRRWCDDNRKRLFMLANSGCLNFCSTQTFHDNRVAHETDACAADAWPVETLACRIHLSRAANRHTVLQGSWIRPEDIDHYSPHFDFVKLATRMHFNPFLVIHAYAHRHYPGNLLDLLEPGYHSLFKGSILDNAAFPTDWHSHVTQCSRSCHTCTYCSRVYSTIHHSLDTLR